MPRAQFEALERRQQARHDRGVDSDKETIQDKDKEEDEDDPQEEAAPLEARIRKPPLTCSSESFFSAQEWRKPSTMTK
jgi:hypothetical protein